MSEKEPKPKGPDDKKEKVNEKKKEFTQKSDTAKKTVDKKGGWPKFGEKKAEYLGGAGLFVFGLFSGSFLLGALGAWIFSWARW